MTARRLSIVALSMGITTLMTAASFAQQPSAAPAAGKLTLGVVLYEQFEPLDVFGPVEMFMCVPGNLLEVVYIAEKAGPVLGGTQSQRGPKVIADYGFDDAPKLDLILVPGGFGTLAQLNNANLMKFLQERAPQAQLTTSVCSGSALLAKAGVLDGKKATTNKSFYDMLISNGPNTEWQHKARWVEDGNVITSSGVSAGIDMALAVIARLWGEDMAKGIAEGTEYVWSRDPHNDPFAKGSTD